MSSAVQESTGQGTHAQSRCLLLLQRSLAIQLRRGPPPQILNSGSQPYHSHNKHSKEHPADEMWMYDKGYNLFQVNLAINAILFMNF